MQKHRTENVAMPVTPRTRGIAFGLSSKQIARVIACDTSLARLVVALGLVLLGVTMSCGMGAGKPGYTLLESAMPIQYWGGIYFAGGFAGVMGAFSERLPYWFRISICLLSMYLWTFLCIAQFADQALPTRTLLLLPATVEVFILIKIVALGKRSFG